MNKQSGSAIFIILIAVALFGALAYAFMQGSKGNTSSMTDEAAKAYATQIIAYGNDIKTAVRRIQLRGYNDTQIDFQNTVYVTGTGAPLNTANPNCTSVACRVFDIAGGGVSPVIAPESATIEYDAGGISSKAGHWAAHQFIVQNVGTSAPELLFSVHELKREICMKINNILGIPNTGGTPPIDDPGGGVYNGSYTSSVILGDDDPVLAGKLGMCFQRGTGANARFQYSIVLIAR